MQLDEHVRGTKLELERLLRQTPTQPDPLREALGAVTSMLEEMEVSAEEMRAQNDELREAREALERDRQHYLELFERAPEAYLVTDADGVVLEANRQAQTLFAATGEAFLGVPLAVFVQPGQRRSFRTVLAHVASGRSVREWAITLIGDEHRSVLATVEPDRRRDEPELRWVLREPSQGWASRQLRREMDAASRVQDGPSDDDAFDMSAFDDINRFIDKSRADVTIIAATLETLVERGDAVPGDAAETLLRRASAHAASLSRMLLTPIDRNETIDLDEADA